MIKNIEDIKNFSPMYIKEFMQGCTIEEKIDTHYMTIEISPYECVIKKANQNPLTRIDLILKSAWHNIYIDWNYLRMTNTEWFLKHAGYVFKVFYIPSEQPIRTKYDPTIRYIFDTCTFNNQQVDIHEVLNELKFPDTYKIDFKTMLVRKELVDSSYKRKTKEIQDGKPAADVFSSLINKDESHIFAVEKPEGYIFKYKSKIFQTCEHIASEQNEKSSYEFLLIDFIRFCKETNYSTKILKSYVKTVCNLFNDYILNWVKTNHNIEKNITAESIQTPYIGTAPKTGFAYIPDSITKVICKESPLYENIFKVLLANLNKGKDENRCIIMSRKHIDQWNNIIKNIRIHSEKI